MSGQSPTAKVFISSEVVKALAIATSAGGGRARGGLTGAERGISGWYGVVRGMFRAAKSLKGLNDREGTAGAGRRRAA